MSYVEDREDAPCATCGRTTHLDAWSVCPCGYVFCDFHACNECETTE